MSTKKSDLMAFGIFRKRLPEEAAPAVAPQVAPVAVAGPDPSTEGDSAKEILELLELELGGMIRQLERAANAVAVRCGSDRGQTRDHPRAHRCAHRA